MKHKDSFRAKELREYHDKRYPKQKKYQCVQCGAWQEQSFDETGGCLSCLIA